MKAINLPLDSKVFGYDIYHEGNHSLDKLAHPNYQTLVPIATSGPFDNNQPQLNQVKTIAITLKKRHRCKFQFEIIRLGNGTTRMYSSQISLSANVNSGTKKLTYEIYKNSNDVEVCYTLDELSDGWRVTLYSTVVNNAERIGVVTLLGTSDTDGVVEYFDGQLPAEPVLASMSIPFNKLYLPEYETKPEKIDAGEIFIVDNDNVRGKQGKVYVKVKNRFNGYTTVEVPTTQRFIPELSNELIPTLTNRNTEDRGHMVISQRQNEQDKLFIFLSDRDGNVSSRMVLTSEYGTRTQRPKEGVTVGFQYFDLSLGKPIWYKGSGVWVDATGADV